MKQITIVGRHIFLSNMKLNTVALFHHSMLVILGVFEKVMRFPHLLSIVEWMKNVKSSETSTKILNYFLNNTMQKYKPKISILKSLWLKKIKAYKHERYAIAIPGNPERMFYYFPLYNSFRYAGTHYYPESDSDLEVIIRCLSFKK